MANRKKRPTRAQWELLERLEKAGEKGLSAHVLPSTQTTNMSVLLAREWVSYLPSFPIYKITEAGSVALAEQRERRAES